MTLLDLVTSQTDQLRKILLELTTDLDWWDIYILVASFLATFHSSVLNFETFLPKVGKDKSEWYGYFPPSVLYLVLGTIFRLFLNYEGNKIFFQFPKGFSLYFALINHNLSLTFASYLLCWLVIFQHLLPSTSERLIQTFIC